MTMFKHKVNSLFFVMLLIGAASPLNAITHGFVHAENGAIVDTTGEVVLRRGMGLGGWLVPEGYMLHFPGFGSPTSIRAQIVDGAVIFSLLDQPGVVLSFFTPPGITCLGVENPHHAAQESLAPVGPGLPAVHPLAFLGVHGKIIEMRFNQLPNLVLGKIEARGQLWFEGFWGYVHRSLI